MRTLIAAPLAAAALVAALSSAAAAAPSVSTKTQVVSGMDQTRVVSILRVTKPPSKHDESGIDRTFHPDYSKALTADQLQAAWNAEINRVFETPISGD